MTIKISFNNINFSEDIYLPENNEKYIINIQDVLANLSSLNIVYNSKLLDETISTTLNFSKDKKDFLIFGTGGSNLGAKALINILQGNTKVNILFYDNIDPINFQNSIKKIDLNKAGIVIISKSGSTPETLSQFSSLIQIFEEKNSLEILYKNSLVITEDKPSPLANIAHVNNCTVINHEKDIGGRYSVFSSVGMVPSIIAGLDVKKIHLGAIEQIKKYRQDKHLKISQLFRYQNFKNKFTNSILMTYSDALYYFGKWYLQLWAESLGKENKGITPIHAVGTTDQHSQLQLYLDGPKDKFFTFITTNHVNLGLQLNNKTMKDHKIDYLIDKTMGDLMQAEQQATIDTFKNNNFPFREIHLDKIDEFSIGQLMAFSMMEVVATCLYYEVNPFDQPAVEQVKKLTKEYLS
jgi:glucose-6-phosphate isomerase